MKEYVLDVNDKKTKLDIELQFSRLKTMLDTGFIQHGRKNFRHEFYQSAIVELLIILDDLLAKIKNVKRIAFKDDIPQDIDLYGDENDITELVRYFRNAVCHINNERRKVDTTETFVSFGMSSGIDFAMKIGDIEIGCRYEDDSCLIMGNKQIYLKRHLMRVYDELKAAYLSIPEFKPGLQRILQ